MFRMSQERVRRNETIIKEGITEMLDQLLLARWQFAITTVYHFLFVPLTLGLSILVAIMHTQYYRTNDDKYKKMVKFWGKLFLINFAMGVATGIVQEFQFGMNWSEYAKFTGDIFGAPLAIEALAAFFIESTFLGIWIFGWDKLPKKVHLASVWLVAFASNLSAFWILTANSFMQNPQGYVLNNGRAEMVDFGALITNPYLWHQFPHVVTAGLTTGAFFVMGISAYHLLKKKEQDLSIFQTSFRYGAVVGLIATLLVAGIGHAQGQYLVETQPMKMAAAEAHWETSDPADFIAIAAIDQENGTNKWELTIPNMLSFLSYNSFSGEVKGINDLQEEYVAKYGEGDYVPQVTPLFWSFRLMVGCGGAMILLVLLGLWWSRKGTLSQKSIYLKLMLLAMALPYLANIAGWLITEMGRQPWIVYGLQTTASAVSVAVPAHYILLTLIGFTVIYGVLAVIDVYLLAKFARKSPNASEDILQLPQEEGSLWI